jgi:hypothetical protein
MLGLAYGGLQEISRIVHIDGCLFDGSAEAE